METTQLEAIAEIIHLTEIAIPSASRRTRFLTNMSSCLKAHSVSGKLHVAAALLPKGVTYSSVESILADGGLGIYPDLINSKCFTDEVFKCLGIRLRSRSVNAVLRALGFESFGKPVFWRGIAHRWYFRGVRPDHPGRLANALEEERLFVE